MFSSPVTPTMPASVSTFISEGGSARLPFTLTWLVLREALAQPQGSAASAMVYHGLQRAHSSQQQPKSSRKLQFENQTSVFSPYLEDVGSSWHSVVDTVYGEGNRGQGIDCRT